MMLDHGFRLCLFCTCTGATIGLGGACAPPAQAAGSRIISVNPRYNELYPGTPGFEDNPKIHVLSYHIHTTAEVNGCLGNTGYGKPIILSDDGYAASDVPAVLSFIEAAAAAGEHYEHFDAHIGEDPPAGGGAMACNRIDSLDDFPESSRTIMAALGQHASRLAPGGTLTVSGRELYWNGQPVTLMGSDWMGALAGLNFDINGYLDILASYQVNLVRVWCIEQWTGTCMGNDFNNGILPFVGTYGQWDLSRLNDAYFTRLRQFVQAAWDRGIVVQLTLFDRCGLVKNNERGTWLDSPYNLANNMNGFLPTPAGKYPAFTGLDGTQIGAVNRAFTQRVVNEVKNYGNVIYEIMNEPHHYFSNQTEWHQWVADIIHETFNAGGTLPVIASQPSPVRLHQGTTATFTVTAEGQGPLQYRWFLNQSALANGGRVSGADGPSLSIEQVRPADVGDYSCQVSNAGGSTGSQAAALTLATLGDFDLDEDVDQADFGFFQTCLSNLGFPYAAGCEPADLNLDTTVDQSDMGTFMDCLGGPGQPPGC